LRLALRKLVIVSTILVLCAGYAPAKPPKAPATKHGHRHGKRKASWKKKGQQAIKPERTTEIQQALIREKYLAGQPSGVWDSRTQAALVKYQADHGWQTKVVPDSRALIKLGLGPNYSSELLNSPAKSSPSGIARAAASHDASAASDKQ